MFFLGGGKYSWGCGKTPIKKMNKSEYWGVRLLWDVVKRTFPKETHTHTQKWGTFVTSLFHLTGDLAYTRGTQTPWVAPITRHACQAAHLSTFSSLRRENPVFVLFFFFCVSLFFEENSHSRSKFVQNLIFCLLSTMFSYVLFIWLVFTPHSRILYGGDPRPSAAST